MTLSDELRALAEEVELIEPADGVEHRAEFVDWLERTTKRLNALADRLQGRVVVTARTGQSFRARNAMWFSAILHCSANGATEAEAIANLQAALDAADNNT